MTATHAAPISRERLAQASVLVVGDAMLDRYWFGAVDRISPEAPVPVVRVSREEERLGGAANVALNVKTLGAQATLLTVVGDDEPARKLRQLLEQQGVNALLGSDPQLYTIVKLRVIGRAQQLIRVDFENQPDHEVLASMLSEYERVLPSHGAVLFSDYGKGGLTHIPRMIELARLHGKRRNLEVDDLGRLGWIADLEDVATAVRRLHQTVLVTFARQRPGGTLDAVEAMDQRLHRRGREVWRGGAQRGHRPSRPGSWRTSVKRLTP